MTSKFFWMTAGLAMAGCAVLGCSDDASSSPSEGGDGGTEQDGSGNQNADGGPQNDGSSGSCTGPAAAQVGLFGAKAARLQHTSDALFVWDRGAGDPSPSSGTTGAIMKLPKAGGEASVLYKPTVASHVVLDVLAEGSDVFTAEFDNDTNSDTDGVLLRIPAGGGSATPVATLSATSDDFGNLVAIDATSVFFTQNDSLYRVPRAGGAPVEIATLGGELVVAQIVGDDLILSQKLAGTNVWRVPRSAASPAEAVKLTDQSNCMGDLLAVPGGYYCASTLAVTKLDANFVAGAKVYDLLDSGDPGSLPRFAGLDGTRVLFGAKAAANTTGPFRSFELGTTTSNVIACGIGSWLEAVVDPSAVYLLQQQPGADAPMQVVKFTR